MLIGDHSFSEVVQTVSCDGDRVTWLPYPDVSKSYILTQLAYRAVGRSYDSFMTKTHPPNQGYGYTYVVR